MKRLLVINTILIGEESGTGNTLKNIFSEYPQSDIMQLSVQTKPDFYKTTICNTVFLSKKCIPIDSGFRSIVKKLKGRYTKNSISHAIAAAIPQRTVKGIFHDVLRGMLDMSLVRLDKIITADINSFSPEIIYTCGCTIRIHKIANLLARKYNIPIILHMMDDWPETVYTTSVFSHFARRAIHNELYETNALSSINFAISEALCSKYETLFHKPYIPLMNPAKYVASVPLVEKREIVQFIYAGSLSLNRWKSLLKIAEIIFELNNTKKRASMKLYVPQSWNTDEIKECFKRYMVEINDYISNEKVQEVYNEADVLIHIESFDENYFKFTRYSLSTKIPEYMGSGKPILAYLPKNLHGGDYISKNNAGLVANNTIDLYSNIIKLIDDASYRRDLAKCGIACAKNNHSLENVHAKLNDAINIAMLETK